MRRRYISTTAPRRLSLSNVTAENILDLMKGDWFKAFEGRLIVSEGEERSLDNVVKQDSPHSIYAAWQYYLEDDWMHEKGTPSVDQFVRHVTRYTVKVGKGRKMARVTRPDEIRWHVVYSCAKRCLGGDDLWGYDVSFKHGGYKAAIDELPLYHENPCPVCKGPCVMNYDWVYSTGSAHADNYPAGEIDPAIAAGQDVVAAVVAATRMEPPPPADVGIDLEDVEDFF